MKLKQGARGAEGGAVEAAGDAFQRTLSALGSPVRREILRLVWDRELPAGEIASAFTLSKPTISQHLSVLRRAGLVTLTAVGTSRRYRARQDRLRSVSAGLAGSLKWRPADDVPERELSVATTKWAVVAGTEVATDQATTFRAFADPEIFSRWLGVPVTIEDGRFACTLEWGTSVRGRYEVVHPPELIAMWWDFEDGNVPVPGQELVAYLRVHPAQGEGSRVEVHQLAGTPEQAEFMELAWRGVLGRLKAGVAEASGGRPAHPRQPRPKFRRP